MITTANELIKRSRLNTRATVRESDGYVFLSYTISPQNYIWACEKLNAYFYRSFGNKTYSAVVDTKVIGKAYRTEEGAMRAIVSYCSEDENER